MYKKLLPILSCTYVMYKEKWKKKWFYCCKKKTWNEKDVNFHVMKKKYVKNIFNKNRKLLFFKMMLLKKCKKNGFY